MIKQKLFYLPLVLALIGIILISGCTQTAGNGFLAGKISIGPLCPVEASPPQPGCQPTAETYKAWPIAVFTAYKVKIAQIEPNLDGTYRVELPAGNYVVDLQRNAYGGRDIYGIGGSNLPASVVISANRTTTLDINIDTGMR